MSAHRTYTLLVTVNVPVEETLHEDQTATQSQVLDAIREQLEENLNLWAFNVKGAK